MNSEQKELAKKLIESGVRSIDIAKQEKISTSAIYKLKQIIKNPEGQKKKEREYSNIRRKKHPEKIKKYKDTYHKKEQGSFNRCQIWSLEDEELITTSNLNDQELSKQIGRSMRAIQKKRCLLKKLQEGGEYN